MTPDARRELAEFADLWAKKHGVEFGDVILKYEKALSRVIFEKGWSRGELGLEGNYRFK